MRFNKFALAGLAVCASALLAGCGGGGDDSGPVAKSDVTVGINPTTGAATVASILGQNFNFTTGIAALGTTASTSLKLTGDAAAPNFAITSGTNSASGTMTYGSCIFTVNVSTFAASHPLAEGSVRTVDICQLRVAVGGQAADAVARAVGVYLVLNNQSSAATPIQVSIDPSGRVTVNGVVIGSVDVVTATGATGSGS